MSAADLQAAGLEASVVGLKILGATSWWPTVKSNPSKDKMAQKYTVVLELANGEGFVDTIEWRARGAGRNAYFFLKLRLVLKMFVDDESRWKTHTAEAQGLATWASKLPEHLPAFFGRFIVQAECHDCKVHRADTLLVGRGGPNLTSVLQQLSQRYELQTEAADLKQEVEKYFVRFLHACEHAHRKGLAYGQDLHSDNVCLHEVTNEWLFVDLEEFASVQQTFRRAMQVVAKKQSNQKFVHPAFVIWQECLQTHILSKDIYAEVSADAIQHEIGDLPPQTLGHAVAAEDGFVLRAV